MNPFYCQECGHHFRTVKAAERASRRINLELLGSRVVEILRTEASKASLATYGGPSAAKLASIWDAAAILDLVKDGSLLDGKAVRP